MAKTFNFKNTSLVLGGAYITGYMDGEPISIEKNEDKRAYHVGADGEVTVTKSADNTATLTVNVKQDSASVPHLQSLLKSDDLFPFQFIDNNTGFRCSGNECYVVREPNRTFGTETQGYEYQILITDYTEA